MTFYQALLVLAAIFPLLIYGDYRAIRKADADPDIKFDLNTRHSSLLLSFAPFVTLFYSQNFWPNLFYLIPLYLYCAVLMYFVNKKGWCPFLRTDISMYGGSGLVVTIIAYFIWFHEGILVPQDSEIDLAPDKKTLAAFWPYYVFVLLFSAAIFSNKLLPEKNRSASNTAFMILTVQAIAYPLLALFTQHYWLSMLAGVLAYAVAMPIALRPLAESARGGIGFVLAYIYMMTAGGSILLYAFLF